MYKYLLAFFFLLSTSVFATTGGIYVTHLDDIPTDAKCASGDSEVLIIDEVSDFSQINDVGKTIFCVEPGNYDVDLELTRSGTSGTPRYIRYYKSAEIEETHPANMDEVDRAIIKELFFLSNTEYWVVDRMTVVGTAEASVRMQPGGGNNIIINRMLVENSGGGAGQVAMGGKNNLVQNSVIRNTKFTAHTDDHCLNMGNSNNDLDSKVVNNEIYNCTGDPIQVAPGPHGGLIAENELYVDSSYYSDCSGNLDPTGDCYCTENAIGFKGGGDGSFPYSVWAESGNTELLYTRNVIWGFNRENDTSDTGCSSGGGVGPEGKSMIFLHGGDGVRVQDNVFWPGENAKTSIGPIMVSLFIGSDYIENTSFINNLFFEYDWGMALPNNQYRYNEHYYNTWVNNNFEWLHGAGDNSEFLCNVIINTESNDVDLSGHNVVFDYNAFYNSDTTDVAGTNDLPSPLSTWDSDSKNEQYCWTRYQITNPTAQCIPFASTTDESPHADICNAPTEASGKGTNNITQLTRVKAGFVAPYLERTIEAEDSAALTYKFVAPINDTYQVWFKATPADINSIFLSYTIGDSPKQIVKLVYPGPTWVKGGLNLTLTAGMKTLKVIKQEAEIEIDKMIVTNNPNFKSP